MCLEYILKLAKTTTFLDFYAIGSSTFFLTLVANVSSFKRFPMVPISPAQSSHSILGLKIFTYLKEHEKIRYLEDNVFHCKRIRL